MPSQPLIVVMGVAASGKTTVGTALSEALGAAFIEADDHHPASNLIKMRKGSPLDDLDRIPWAETLRDQVAKHPSETTVVLACSALTGAVQSTLMKAPRNVCWAHLELDSGSLLERMSSRQHFMPPELLDSQLSALDPPASAQSFDAAKPVVQIVRDIRLAFSL